MVATLGTVFPSLIIIMIIAAFLQNFAEQPVVIHAFNGVRACVCALILSSVLKLRKSTVVDLPAVLIFMVVAVLAVVGNFVTFHAGTALAAAMGFLTSPIVLVVAAGVTGLCVRAAGGGLSSDLTSGSSMSSLRLASSPSAADWPPSPSSPIWGHAPAGSPPEIWPT